MDKMLPYKRRNQHKHVLGSLSSCSQAYLYEGKVNKRGRYMCSQVARTKLSIDYLKWKKEK